VAAIGSWPAQTRSIGRLIEEKQVGLGQSFSEVRAALGEPAQINKTDTYWKTTEDWVYPEGQRTFLLTFEAGTPDRRAVAGSPRVTATIDFRGEDLHAKECRHLRQGRLTLHHRRP
jgi:hypothetical protein